MPYFQGKTSARRTFSPKGPHAPAMEPLEPRLLLDSHPIITEFMADNTETLLDNNEVFSDWIEIYNPTDATVQLDDYCLTDNPGDLTKWRFPAGETLDPGAYLVVFASNTDDPPVAGAELHTNFALSKGGEYVALVYEDGGSPFSVSGYDFPQQFADVSYGFQAGATWNTLVVAGAPLSWHVPTPGDAGLVPAPGDPGWTAPGFDDSSWTDATAYGAAGILVTEIGAGDTDFVEVQNCSNAAIDTTGWLVLVNDASPGTVNDVNSVPWNLPASVAAGEVLYRTDDGGDAYWGSDILWADDGAGWVMVLDSGGRVMDFVAWGYDEPEIASLDIDYGEFAGITVAGAWFGQGVVGGGGEPGGAVEPTFTAFNDHVAGGDTHAFATTYATNGDDSGLLKNVTTGAGTGVTLTTSQVGVGFGSPGAAPSVGTDAYDIFDGYVDFRSGTGTSIEIASGDSYTHAFTGLDTGPDVTYTFAGTAIRGDAGYTNRWTLVTLDDADGATAAHSSGLGVVVVSPTQVAIWTGHNNAASQGFVAAWTGIDPGPDGDFSVISTRYTGATPGVGSGAADGDKGYGLAGIRLQEVPPSGPLGWLQRSGDIDTNTDADFRWSTNPTKGAQNANLIVPFGEVVPTITGIGFSDGQPEFDDLIATDVGGDMQGASASLWTRIEFEAGDLSAFDALTLKMKYDDGFVAYLNGVEVAARNAPATLAYDSGATAAHPNAEAVVYEDIDISGFLGSLQVGSNVLAIHGLNDGAAGADFLILPRLVAGREGSPPRFFGNPTPGALNDPSLGAPTATVSFSRPSGLFTGPSIPVGLSADSPGAVIHYTLDGSIPTEGSPQYAGPITISTTTQVRARAYESGRPPSVIATEAYVKLAAGLQTYTSDLPVLVIDTFGGGVDANSLEPSFIGVFEPQEDGWTDFTAGMDLATRAGVKQRGSSNKHYGFETWDDYDEDKDVSLLGLPPESDFVLYRSGFDKSLMNNTFMFELSNQIGQYASRTLFVEVYLNTGGGEVSASDHIGVYAVIEKIKRGPDRVDVEALDAADNTEPDVTGGYMLKIDRLDPGDSGFHTSRGTPTFYGYLCYVYPKEEDLTGAQAAWIRQYLEDFEDALYGADFADPELGYAKYIDVDSFIDHHILNELAKNPDAFWLSGYMYKPRGGKLAMGPIWDFDRALGFENRSDNPVGYVSFEGVQLCYNYDWWGRLFEDPDFVQRYIDRRYELRQGPMSLQNMHAIIDAQAAQLAASQSGNSAWPGQVNDLKNWVADRIAWIDDRIDGNVIPGAAQFSRDSGPIDPGDELTILAPTGTVYYTLDGSDPRMAGGGVSPGAVAIETGGSTTRLLDIDHVWSYDQSDTDLPDEWIDTGYPDGDWPTGQGLLYVEGAALGPYPKNTPLTLGPMTFYFRTHFTFNGDPAGVTELRLGTVLDDGAIIYLNGTELRRVGINLGYEPGHDGNSSRTVGDASYETLQPVQAADFNLVQGDNVLAVEVHQNSSASSDIVWGMELDAVTLGQPGQDAVVLSGNMRVTARVQDGPWWSAPTDAVFLVDTPADAGNLALTEIMYHPAPPTPAEMAAGFTDADDFEFVELTNTGGETIALGGAAFIDGIDLEFDANLTVAPGERVVVVANQAAFEYRYGAGLPVVGQYGADEEARQLANGGEDVQLQSILAATILDFAYADGWFDHTDGGGYSLVVRDPLQDPLLWNSKDGWRASWTSGGNPGEADPSPLNPGDIVINEVLTHQDDPIHGDWIELVNTTAGQTIDITGWYLSDAPAALAKWQIPTTDPLGPGQYAVFTQAADFGGAFGLSEFGDEACLTAAEGGLLRGYRTDEDFGASDRGVTFGRHIKSTGRKDFVAMVSPTMGGPNSGPVVPDVVINEIMYHPETGGLEFIELANRTGADVPLHDSEPTPNPWAFTDGIDFTFPAGAYVPAGGYALVIGVDRPTFESACGPVPGGVNVYGPWDGALENAGERVELSRPGDPEWTAPPPGEPLGYVPYIVVEKVTYNDVPAWPTEPDGLGPSLERRVAGAYGNDVVNWAASVSSGGTPGAPNTAGPPQVAAVVLNPDEGRTVRGVSEIDPSALGVQTVRVTFNEEVVFAPGDVTADKVEFDDEGNPIGTVEIPAENFTVSATAPKEMTITFADSWQQTVDTWVRITLADAITDLDSNLLDGEPAANSSGLGYIYDAGLDLPSGNGAAGGDAVFYVGSLRGDLRGFGPEPANDPPNGTIDSWDIGGFTQKFQERDLDADFRGFGPEPENDPPNGDVDSWDIGGFTSRYSTALATGAHLGNLPTSDGGGMAAGAPSPLPPLAAETAALTDSPEAALLAEAAEHNPQLAIRALPSGSRLKAAQDAGLPSVVFQSEIRNPNSAMRNSQSAIRNPQLAIRALPSGSRLKVAQDAGLASESTAPKVGEPATDIDLAATGSLLDPLALPALNVQL